MKGKRVEKEKKTLQLPSLSGERVEFEVDAEVPGPLQSGETAGLEMDVSGYAAGGGKE